jgi:predicted transcriptional regulator
MNVRLTGQTVTGNQELYQIGLKVLEANGLLKTNQVKRVETISLNVEKTIFQEVIIFKTREEMIDPVLSK